MISAWMLYSVVLSIPIVLGAMALGSLLRRHRIAERGVWVGGLVLAAAVPLVRLLPERVQLPTGPVPTVNFGLPEVVEVTESALLAGLDLLLTLGWLAFSLVIAFTLLRSVHRLLSQRSEWRPEEIAGTEVLVSADVGPAVFGVVRPEIVLPTWMSEVPADQVDLIIRHEVQHIRAGDPWLVAGVLVLRVLFPWHPGVWALTAGLRQAIELDCDRRVLRERQDVRSYGETVLAVASRMRPGPAQPVAAFTESVRFIKRRLLAMTQPQKRLGHYGALSLAALVALVLVGACETPVPSLAPEEVEDATFTVQEVEIPAPTEQSKLVPTDESVPETEVPAGVIRVREIPPGEVQSRLAPADESALESGEPGGTLRARELPAEEATFRAFTVAPSIVNRDEVVTAMEQNYPPLLRDAGIGGTIKVMMFVSDDGTLTDLRIGESSGHQALDDAALRVARAYRFAPALDGDDPVATWIQFPITFQVR